MAKHYEFMTITRQAPSYRPVKERTRDFNPVQVDLSDEQIKRQASRCMDCGVPFCHMYGCPVSNRVPDYSDALYHDNWKEALELLHSTNNFPDFTGRICPALCEAACTLSINEEPTTCQHIEMKITEHGWEQGWIIPQIAPVKTGRSVAVIGSGPSGLAAAQQLARQGHDVTVFEKSDRIGGLLMYGIPNFKLEKQVVERRLEQMRQEGVKFETEVEVGNDISPRYLKKNYDVVLIASGTPQPRDLKVPGRELKGVYFALDFLSQQTRQVLGDKIPKDEIIDPKVKNVVVVGGGDTGSDCVGSAIRRGCSSVTQIELLPQPPEGREIDNPWPEWPRILRTSTSHKEGCERLWSITTKEIHGKNGKVSKLGCARLEWEGRSFKEIPGSDFLIDADIVLLSMGFIPFNDSPLVQGFGLETDERGNIAVAGDYMSSVDGVFATGDTVMGASLVVHAIAQGRNAAEGINAYLRT